MRFKGFLFFSLASLLYYFWPQTLQQNLSCPFCDTSVLERQKFYEDDLCYALCTHRPIVKGHCLVIPKRHAERFEELRDEEILRMGQVLRRIDNSVSKVIGTSSYLLLQKNGKEVGQSVPHVHFHYLPRKSGESSSLKFLMQMFLANVLSPINDEEMGLEVELMKKSIQSQ